MTRHRNVPFDYLQSLTKLPGLYLVSLQKGAVLTELLDGNFDDSRIIDLGQDVDTTNGAFMDTAAVMMNLDLVITCDTSVAHLAGALGIPVWVALPYVPDWRWMLEAADTPWYPTMRLFRQDEPGNWQTVFHKIENALAEWVHTIGLNEDPRKTEKSPANSV
jgi:hypothetical protein